LNYPLDCLPAFQDALDFKELFQEALEYLTENQDKTI
jgi:hypothetical protein